MAGGSESSTARALTELDDRVLQDLYAWIDQIPLTRPKKNITRDFSDGGKFSYFTLL